MEHVAEPQILSVTELTRSIRRTLEKNPLFTHILVEGELSNVTYHSSGHIYFTMKDEGAVLSAVFFKNANRKMTFRLEEGMSVQVLGSITLFEKRGSYQINVSMVKKAGQGEIQRRIEELRKKLLQEGIFSPDHKKAKPFLPRRVGIVTSPTGAAFRDILKVALRRYPNMEIVLAPAKVQGDDAPPTIVRGIEELNREEYSVDIIIAGRGGGSFEDLLPFNDETVVRAFYQSRVPIVSAVGHQVDHPLCDDAADIAAATPSHAAEIVFPVKKDLQEEVGYYLTRSKKALASVTQQLTMRLDSVTTRKILQNPVELIHQRSLHIKDLEHRLRSRLHDTLSDCSRRFYAVPDISHTMESRMMKLKHAFSISLQALHQLSPLNTIQRGYAIVTDPENRDIKTIDTTKKYDTIHVHLKGGHLGCTIDSVIRGTSLGKKEKN